MMEKPGLGGQTCLRTESSCATVHTCEVRAGWTERAGQSHPPPQNKQRRTRAERRGPTSCPPLPSRPGRSFSSAGAGPGQAPPRSGRCPRWPRPAPPIVRRPGGGAGRSAEAAAGTAQGSVARPAAFGRGSRTVQSAVSTDSATLSSEESARAFSAAPEAEWPGDEGASPGEVEGRIGDLLLGLTSPPGPQAVTRRDKGQGLEMAVLAPLSLG
ncbi:uncharacterized protein LOC134365598 [Cynocephalus volans]|uniref:uncharacterized protein LOC134365598 n=1 Tax=Cynocephalus volans TaxID=110931 RepID=UPI002FCA655D